MDLRKVPNEEKLNLCRKYFYIGIFCLPFLWLVNFIWFFKTAFKAEQFNEQKQIRKYVILSAIGTLLWTLGLTTWNVYFQMNRATVSWGDDLSFIIPIGRP